MENYEVDIKRQFDIVVDNAYTDVVCNTYETELYKIFKHIYLINFLKNRIELERFFDTEYMNISMSCMIESFSLLLNNYPRGSSLVLRSSLENILKHSILKHNLLSNSNYPINDRNYTANKISYDNLISSNLKGVFKSECKSINSKMESHYKKLSGISHSLVVESRNNLILFFSDLDDINPNNISQVIHIFDKMIVCIVENVIILCEPSLKYWERNELEKLLLVVFGKRKTKSFSNNLKL